MCMLITAARYLLQNCAGKDSEKEDSEARKMERSFVFVFFF
jgi:hypothetical protein